MNQKPSVPRVRISEAANNRTGQANARETDSITDRKSVLARENFRTREKCGGREKRKEELEKGGAKERNQKPPERIIWKYCSPSLSVCLYPLHPLDP